MLGGAKFTQRCHIVWLIRQHLMHIVVLVELYLFAEFKLSYNYKPRMFKPLDIPVCACVHACGILKGIQTLNHQSEATAPPSAHNGYCSCHPSCVLTIFPIVPLFD